MIYKLTFNVAFVLQNVVFFRPDHIARRQGFNAMGRQRKNFCSHAPSQRFEISR